MNGLRGGRRTASPVRITLATTRGAIGGCPRRNEYPASHEDQSWVRKISSSSRTSWVSGMASSKVVGISTN